MPRRPATRPDRSRHPTRRVTPPAKVIAERLEVSRRELLDLGMRNPLLNYRLLRARGLEVADEIPAQVFRLLVQEGRAMSFLPRMDEEEDGLTAQPREIATTETPAARHTDRRLQTDVSSDEVQSRLLATYYAANSFVQEQGVNILYLALGMLTWYEADSSEEPRRAPLLLVPVELTRSNVRERFRLSYTGEDPGENLSLIEKAKSDFGIDMPSLPDIEIESGDVDVDGYLQRVEEAVKEMPRWSVAKNSIVLGLFSFRKFLMFRDLDVETWPEDEQPSAHPIINALLDQGFSEPEPRLDIEDDLDEHLPPQAIHHVLDADGSQTLAIADVAQGRNLVVQGPPGTGKSQTIANIIAQALGQERTVLFVSEKMAALEVVKRRLDSVGLGAACLELHSNKTTKTAVLSELKRTLDLGPPRLGDVEGDLESLARTQERLNAYSRAVNTPVRDSGATPYRALGELSLLQQRYQDNPLPTLDVPAMAEWSRGDFQAKEELVAELQTRVSSLGVPREHPFWGSLLTVLLPTHQEQLGREVSAAQATLSRLTNAMGGLAGALGLVAPTGPMEAQALAFAALRLLEAPGLQGVDVTSPKWLDNHEDLVALVDAGAKLDALHRELDGVLLSDAWEQDAQEVREVIDEYRGKWWRPLSREYRLAKQKVASYCLRRPPSGLQAQVDLLDAILEAQRQSDVLSHHSDLAQELFGPKWRREQSDWAALTEVLQYLHAIHTDINAGTVPGGILEFLAQGRPVDTVASLMAAAEDAGREHESTVAAVVLSLDLDEEARFGEGGRLGSRPFLEQEETFAAWSRQMESLHGMVGFNNIAELCRSQHLGGVVDMAANWPRAGGHLTNAFRRAWYEKLMEMALAENPVLQGFDGDSHRQTVERFRSLDVTSLNHNRARLTHSHWQRLPQREAGGQLGILLRQFELRRRHLPIRKLLQQAGNAVQAIKPVFMMSPLSIAAYIPPGSLHFDLVVFDEASQVTPVEALGAILRGRQVVVMGDDKQLPPTRFFDSVVQGDDQDDDSPTADIESILGLFALKGAPKRMLRWHYRSRHESLIAVSNQEFYENSLLIFPSPDTRKEEVGLGFHHLANTVYDRGRSSTNVEEAKAVAQAVMNHARDYPDMTLGVAAFSVKQMQVIRDQLEVLRREDPTHEAFFNSHPNEPFFIKNLETVQGDERDVIFISVGYGRDASGRLDMNFGPLNGDGGERRLNVLITRAKHRCEVFTNLEADDIDLGRTNAKGVRALKTYLAYCQHGTLEIPAEHAGEGVNPFEEAVASALRGEGYDIRHQVGAAGYFIDLAVVDPAKPGRFLLGVECDGASYHSALWARDRDRLRQQVLEGLGWKLYRIWSTDWFRQPQRELQRAVQAIEQAKEGQTNQATGPVTAITPEAAVPREENREGARRLDALPKYDIAELRPPASRWWELREAPPQYLAPFVEKVVIVESPVHTSEVSRRIADAFGTKLGRRIQAAIDNAITAAVRTRKIRRERGFLWCTDMEEAVLRDRSELPATSRKLELIPPEEVALAVHRAVSGAYGIETEEAIAATGRVLGFGRITAETRTGIELAIRKMVERGELHDQSGQLMI